MERDPVRIVIAGGGSAGWMTAAALARTMGRAVAITLVESEAIGTVGVGEATIPQIHHFNALMGFSEGEFLAATKGTVKLGIEFDGWHRAGEAYMHAFGHVGRAVGVAPFRQLFVATGGERRLGDYSFNEVAARAGRFHPDAGTQAVPPLVHAYHFDAGLYAAMLRRVAEGLGVERIEGRIERAERDGEGGDVTTLRLDGEREIAGDLFIDCTGFRALLIGEAMGAAFDDWSDLLPCDRAIAMPSGGEAVPRPYTRSIAGEAGWQWRIPLQHRTGNGHVYCSAFLSDAEAERQLADAVDGEALGEPRLIKFTTGRREPWVGNVVALGLAAGFMEPLESTSIHLVQSGIERLLKLFPGGGDDDARRAAFNAQSKAEWEAIRDFLVAHYHLNARHGEPFWDACRAMKVPASLREKIALFEEAGVIDTGSHELFTAEGWQQLFFGQGLMPRTVHPAVAAQPREEVAGFLDSLARAYAARAAQLPTHQDYLDHVMKEAA